jgi:DNA-binding CsgD family transcriptional regulator
MEHVTILGLVLFLVAGSWSAAAVLRERNVFGGDFLESMWRNLLCYIAYNLIMACLIYINENISELAAFISMKPIKAFCSLLLSALLVAMAYYFSKMIFRLGGRPLPVALAKVLPLSFLLPAIAVGVRTFSDPVGGGYRHARLFLHFFMMPLHAVCLACIIWLVLWNGKRPKGKERDSVAAFALFQAICFAFYIDTAAYYLPFLRPWPELVSILYNRATEILYVITPWIWLKYFYVPLRKDLWSNIRGAVDFETFHREHELTRREVEVLGLLVEGRSYRQIGESLFISVNTVKNHAYSLYRKLDVGSRHELIGKVGDFGRGFPSAPVLVR